MSSSAAALRLSSPLPSASSAGRRRRRGRAGAFSALCGIGDLIGGDLVWPDLGRWLDDVEKHKALAVYPPHEGGYEGRYLNRLRYKGYRFLDLSARGLGDPESTLTKIHPVCPSAASPRKTAHSKMVFPSRGGLQAFFVAPRCHRPCCMDH